MLRISREHKLPMRTIVHLFVLWLAVTVTDRAAQPQEDRDAALLLEDWDRKTVERTVDFVSLGYSDVIHDDSFLRSLNFTTDCIDTKYLIPAIRVIDSYNAFSGPAVAEGLGRFRGRVACAEFGRMGSPILWLDFSYWTHQREDYTSDERGERITDAEFDALYLEAKRIFVDELHADDHGVDETFERKVYFWWD